MPQRYGTAESQAKQALFFLMTKLASWKKLHDEPANNWAGPTPLQGGGDFGGGGGMQQDGGFNNGGGDFNSGPQVSIILCQLASLHTTSIIDGFLTRCSALFSQNQWQPESTMGDFRPDTAAAIMAVLDF